MLSTMLVSRAPVYYWTPGGAGLIVDFEGCDKLNFARVLQLDTT